MNHTPNIARAQSQLPSICQLEFSLVVRITVILVPGVLEGSFGQDGRIKVRFKEEPCSETASYSCSICGFPCQEIASLKLDAKGNVKG